MSKMGEYIREKMEIEMVDSVDELEDVKNGMGVSGDDRTDDNVVAGVFGSSSQNLLQQGGVDDWIKVFDDGDQILIENKNWTMVITPRQVDHLIAMLEVVLRERDNAR